jgi:allophanate hydrolase
MAPPHVLRIVPGPEWDFFNDASLRRMGEREQGRTPAPFTVTARLNRTGIRLEGDPILFREKADRSIVSEGVLPGTVQVPGDGMPIIVLYERTIGGYARMGIVAGIDRDRLAHLRPRDPVVFRVIGFDEAERFVRNGTGEYPDGLPQ